MANKYGIAIDYRRCIGCGSCEAVCPQQIKISEAMKDFAGKLG